MPLKEKTWLLLLSAVAFPAGFFLTYGKPNVENTQLSSSLAPENPSLSLKNKKLTSLSTNSTVSPRSELALFSKKLNSNLTSEDCARLFDEILTDINFDDLSNVKMSSLLEKWGTLAPKQALEKIKNAKYGSIFTTLIFNAWATKYPETAVAYYEESQDPQIKSNNMIPAFLIDSWTAHDPEQSWEWIQKQSEKNMDDDMLHLCRESFIRVLISKYPERVSEFVEKSGYLNWAHNGYALGEKVLSQLGTTPEWLDKLPKKIRLAAEAGQIMGESKGSLPEVAARISGMDAEKQKEILEELVDPILDANRLDIKERINWFVDTFPEESFPRDLKYYIHSWMLEDDDAKPWVDSLPPGKKKDLFQRLYKNRPNMTIIR